MQFWDKSVGMGAYNSAFFATSPAFTNAVAEKIVGFSNLPVGWHYGAGGPVTPGTIKLALQLNDFLNRIGFSDTDAFPGVDGEISLGTISGERYIEIIVDPNDVISIATDYRGKQEGYVPGLTYAQAEIILKDLAVKIWSMRVSFTQITLTLGSIASRAWLSKTPPITAVYQSSTAIASNIPEQIFASTPGHIIQHKLESDQFTGDLMTPYSLKATG